MGVVAVGSWGLGNQATIEALACQATVVSQDRLHRQSQPPGASAGRCLSLSAACNQEVSRFWSFWLGLKAIVGQQFML